MDGLIVDDMKILLMYVPLVEEGFNLMIALISSSAFSNIFFESKDTLPIEACTIPAFSTLKSIFPPLHLILPF